MKIIILSLYSFLIFLGVVIFDSVIIVKHRGVILIKDAVIRDTVSHIFPF